MEVRELMMKFSGDSQGFEKSAEKVKSELNALNKKFFENKSAMKTVQQEIKRLTEEQKKLEAAERTNQKLTAEEKKQYEENAKFLKQLIATRAELRTEEQQLKAKISDTTSELKKQNQSASEAGQKLNQLGTVLKSLALGYMGKKLYEYLIDSNAQMEQYLTSFTVMIGDAEKAKKLMDDLTDFAARTPLKIENITSNAQLLMNYGVAADDVVAKLTDLGNLASGDATKLERVSMAYGQMLAKGKVSGEELRQMTEAGVPLLQALADTMGKTTGEIQSMISKSKVGISDLDNAIGALTTGDGKFAGMMDKQSQTLNGLLSTLEDNLQQFGRDIGEESFAVVKDQISQIMKDIEKAKSSGTLDEIAQSIGKVVAGTVNLIKFAWQCKDVIFGTVSAMVAWKATFAITNTIAATVQAVKSFSIATQGAAVAQGTLNAIAAVNPYVLLASALAAVVVGVTAFSAAAITGSGKSAKLSEEISGLKSEIDSVNDSLSKNKNRINELYNNNNLTTAQEKELSTLQAQNKELERKKILLEETERIKLEENKENVIDDFENAMDSTTGDYIDRRLKELRDSYKEYQDAIGFNITEAQAEHLDELDAAIADFEKQKDSLTAQNVVEQNLSDYDALIKKREKGIALSENEISLMETLKVALTNSAKTLDDYSDKYGIDDDVSRGWRKLSQTITETLGLMNEADDESENALLSTEELSTEEAETLTETLAALKAEYDSLVAAQSEYNNTGELTTETLAKIIEQYPDMETAVEQYIQGLIDEKTLLEQIQTVYKKDEDNFRKSLIAKIENNSEFYNRLLNNNQSFVESISAMYGIDLENYKTYSEAKYGIAVQLLGSITKNWATFYNIENNVMTNAMNSLARTNPAQAQAIINAVGQYRNLMSSLGQVTTFDAVEFEPSSSSSSSSSKSGGTSSSNSTSTASNAENNTFKLANEAFKKLVNDRIDEIKKLTDAATDAANERIAAIDAEIEARKRLTEDNDIQKQINAVKAQLQYSQMDEFSRMELEKQLKKLQSEQEETLWQRTKEDEKKAIQAELESKKEYYNAWQQRIQDAETYATRIFSDLSSGSTSNSSIVNNNSNAANITIVTSALTMAQVERKIKDMLGEVWN